MRTGLLALAIVTVAGCVDFGTEPWEDEPAADPGSPPPNPNRPGGDAGAAPRGDGGGETPEGLICPHPGGQPQDFFVYMVSNSFQSDSITICIGDTVIWENQDTKEHTVVSGTPEIPDGMIRSGKLYFGDTFSYTFDDPGDFLYFCSTHKKKMRDALVSVL